MKNQLLEERSVLLDGNINNFINDVVVQVKNSSKSKIIFKGEDIRIPLTWATLNYKIIINIGIFADSYTNLDNYKPYESDIIPETILANEFVINIFIPGGKKLYSLNKLKEDLHHELLHVYQFNEKVNFNYLKNKNHVNFDEIKTFDNYAYKYILKFKNNNDNDISDFASILYFIVPEEQDAMLNSYYEELLNTNRYNIRPIKFKHTEFYKYLTIFYNVLNKLHNDPTYLNKIKKYFKPIITKYFFNINKNLNDKDFDALLIKKLNKLFIKIEKRGFKVYSLVTDIMNKINKKQNKKIPHFKHI